jgi:glutathione S-transferase
MKIYDFSLAPNPRRVRIFLAEKGVQVPYEQVDLLNGKNRSPEMLKKNPFGALPVLELDDGTCIAESVAICRYFDELHPEPALFGKGAKERALVEMWNRRMELEILGSVGRTAQNLSPFFKGRFEQFPDYGEASRKRTVERMSLLDQLLEGRNFIAGDNFTIADITAFCAIDLAKQLVNMDRDPNNRNIARWYDSVNSRPSARA